MNLFENNRREKFSFTDDMVFHMIYGQDNDRSKQALIALLNTVTGDDVPDMMYKPIKDINILNPINYRKRENYKEVEFDIRLETDAGDLFDVEMEKQPDKHFKKRCILYIMKLNDKALDKGQDYDRIRNMTMVSFAGGTLFDDEGSYHGVFGINDKKNKRDLEDVVSFHFIEIDKVDSSRAVSDMTPLERVSLYFRYANDPSNEELLEQLIDSGEEAIILAENIFRELTADDLAYEMMLAREKFQHRYNTDLSEARKEGLEQGEKLGRSEGEASGRAAVAKALKDKGVDIKIIAETSGLSIEDVEKL